MKKSKAFMQIVLLAAVSLMCQAAGSLAQVCFYVSTEGNDTWSGKLAVPNTEGNDGPFATLTRARDAIRHLRASMEGTLAQPVTVVVRRRRYGSTA